MSIDPNSGIRKQDGRIVINSVAGNEIGRDLAWNWLRNEWERVSAYHSSKTIIRSVTSDFNTPLKLKELTEFYNDHKSELGSADRNTRISIQNVKANVKWMEDNYHIITDWLKSKINSN